MRTKERLPRKRYSPEFKLELVRLALEQVHIRTVIDRQFAPYSIMISHRVRSRFRMALDQPFASSPITFSHHPITD